MADAFYIPVGTKLTPAFLRTISLEQMKSREVFDPRYAGFEADFEWQRYLDVTIPDSPLRTRVIGALDQFARTPEGQHMIRQAGAMQNYRIYGKTDPKHRPQARVPIGDGITNLHMPSNGAITYNLQDIVSFEYRGMDGQYYDWSVQHIVFHELSHSMDAVSTHYNKEQLYRRFAMPLLKAEQAYDAVVQTRLPDMAQVDALMQFREQYGAPLSEYPTIRTTNAFMQRYYNEPPRALSHADSTASRKETPEEMLITNPTNLGADHFYDEILSPPATPAVATAPGMKR